MRRNEYNVCAKNKTQGVKEQNARATRTGLYDNTSINGTTNRIHSTYDNAYTLRVRKQTASRRRYPGGSIGDALFLLLAVFAINPIGFSRKISVRFVALDSIIM